MTPYRPQADDVSEAVDRQLFELYRTWTPEQGVQRMWELNAGVRERMFIGLRAQFPGASERELELRYAALLHGAEFVQRHFGWNPDGEAPFDAGAAPEQRD